MGEISRSAKLTIRRKTLLIYSFTTPIRTKIETISPEKATEYLKRNKINRPLRQSVIEQYALDMRKGHWLVNHQGIAFDSDGNLIDGQHRLEAIRMAKVPVAIMVSMSVPMNYGLQFEELTSLISWNSQVRLLGPLPISTASWLPRAKREL